jgi:mannose-6-phosphate isomerase-like protein (cupin superfamily)
VSEQRQQTFRRASWDEMPALGVPERPPGYVHPWPTDRHGTAHDYEPLGSDTISFVIVHYRPGESGQHHCHASVDEIHVLMEGRCQIRIDDEVIEANRHDAFLVHAAGMRSMHNHSDEDCWWLVMAAPPDEFLEPGLVSYKRANELAWQDNG